MIEISLMPHTGKWKVVVFGEVLGENYSSASKACEKASKYLKGQGK